MLPALQFANKIVVATDRRSGNIFAVASGDRNVEKFAAAYTTLRGRLLMAHGIASALAPQRLQAVQLRTS